MNKISFTIFVVLLLTASSCTGWAQNIFKLDIVPAPPKGTRIQMHREEAEVNQINLSTHVTHYQSPLSPNEIIDFYQQVLPAKDWQADGASRRDTVALASFSKAKEQLSISAYEMTKGRSDVYINRAQRPDGLWAKLEPGEDTPGKDLSWAPRYPGALRRLYRRDKQTNLVTIIYLVGAQPEDIIDFYQYRMPNNGWRFVRDVQLAQVPGLGSGSYTTLFFKGFRGQCQVSINQADEFQGETKTSSVLINYMPEQAEGEGR